MILHFSYSDKVANTQSCCTYRGAPFLAPLVVSSALLGQCWRNWQKVSIGVRFTPGLQIQSKALLSNSSIKSATALEQQGQSGQSLTASGKVRKEVPLASQEKKEGAMQYVLYVSLIQKKILLFITLTLNCCTLGPPLIKLPTGPARVPCGRWLSVLPAALLKWCIYQLRDTTKIAWELSFEPPLASRTLWLLLGHWQTKWHQLFDKFMTKCPIHDGLSAWEAVPMAVATITTVILSFVAVTG